MKWPQLLWRLGTSAEDRQLSTKICPNVYVLQQNDYALLRTIASHEMQHRICDVDSSELCSRRTTPGISTRKTATIVNAIPSPLLPLLGVRARSRRRCSRCMALLHQVLAIVRDAAAMEESLPMGGGGAAAEAVGVVRGAALRGAGGAEMGRAIG